MWMGMEDRDWYREAYKEKEKKYGSDFSRNPGRTRADNKVRKASGLKTVMIYVAVIAVVIAAVIALQSPTVKALFNQ